MSDFEARLGIQTKTGSKRIHQDFNKVTIKEYERLEKIKKEAKNN